MAKPRCTLRALLFIAALILPASLSAQLAEHPEHHYFELGDFALELGETLPHARVLYVTHGTLNADRSNAVLIPSWYGGDHHGYDFLIGPDAALDPAEYFVIVTEMFASGGSSSPSNADPPQTHDEFSSVTIRDNVEATHRLVTEAFGITHLQAVIGFSMGAQQAFQWAVSHPEFMDVIVPIAGTAKTYPHGIVRLESALTLITHDPEILAGRDTLSAAGSRAWALHWAAWTRSHGVVAPGALPLSEHPLLGRRHRAAVARASGLPAPRPGGPGPGVAIARCRRHARLRGGRRARLGLDPRAGHLHARRDRHVFSDHRRRVRAAVHSGRRLPADSVAVGAHGRSRAE